MTVTKEKYLIIGCGKTGLSCARFLLRRGLDVSVLDTRSAPPCMEQITALPGLTGVYCGEFNDAVFAGNPVVIVSPGVAEDEPVLCAAREKGLSVIGDIELFYQYAKAPVVAITGSNGKSTVTSLLADMAIESGMQAAVGGNLGTPALDLIADTVDAYILEVSSFQLEYVQEFSPDIAIILNVSADHLDRYQDIHAYRRAKENIYQKAQIRVINKDICEFKEFYNEHARFFGAGDTGQAGHRIAGQWLMRGDERLIHTDEIRLEGRHNWLNVLAALCLGEAMSLPLQAMKQAIHKFTGLPHRVEKVAQAHAICWINDSKGTNVGASEAAVYGVSGQVVLIAGGIAKENDFSLLAEAMKVKGRIAILIGRDAPLLGKALCGFVPVVYAEDMVDAVDIAARYAKAGDSVLLSPACASFDMYTDYMERGNAFKRAVYQKVSMSEVFV